MNKENTKKKISIDPIFERVAKDVLSRGIEMNNKHGNNYESVKANPVQLIQELREELIDGLIYLEKLKGVLDGKKIY
tara:strand:+ start:6338 stop:6568 length:231 start_codon:yes stop_codon:yes gene_type:complete